MNGASREDSDEDELVDLGPSKGLVKRSSIKDKHMKNLIAKCTVCQKQISNLDTVKIHIDLLVLLCKKCYDFYDDGEFSQDESGDKYCRWCAQGGKLVGCDFCKNVFCESCIRKNFGRDHLTNVQKQEQWHCFKCDPEPLKPKIAFAKLLAPSQKKEKKKFNAPKESSQINIEKDKNLKLLKKTVLGTKETMIDSIEKLSRLNSILKQEDISEETINKSIKYMNKLILKHMVALKVVATQFSQDFPEKKVKSQDEEKPSSYRKKESTDDESHDSFKKEDSPIEESKESPMEEEHINQNSESVLTDVDMIEEDVENSPTNDVSQNDMDEEKSNSSNNEKVDDQKEIDSSEEATRIRKNKTSKKNEKASKISRALKVSPTNDVSQKSIDEERSNSPTNEKVDAKKEIDSPEKTNPTRKKEKNKTSKNNGEASMMSEILKVPPIVIMKKLNDSVIKKYITADSDDEKDEPAITKQKSTDKGGSSNKEDSINGQHVKKKKSVDSPSSDQSKVDEPTENLETILKDFHSLLKKSDMEDNASDDDVIFLNETSKTTTMDDNSENESNDCFTKKRRSKRQVCVISSNENSNESSISKKKAPQKRRRDTTSSSSDSDDSVVMTRSKKYKRVKTESLKIISDNSDSDSSDAKDQKSTYKRRNAKAKSDDSDSGMETPKKNKKNNKKSKNEEDDEASLLDSNKKRKNIRYIYSKKDLKADTKAAAQEEKERQKRVLERQKLYNQIIDKNQEGQQITSKLVLEVDPVSKEELVEINQDLISYLKPHQVDGVKFIWECLIESLDRLKETEGSGCVLAHCMGLGKTLQVIVFIHTVLANPHTSKFLKTALVMCPYNTVNNWANEFEYWLDKAGLKLNVVQLASIKDPKERLYALQDWQEEGGILIISYDMFRLTTQTTKKNKKISKKMRESFSSCLLEPGPDIVVCDEGHVLKNIKSAIAKVTNTIGCKRRIILTGTPLQNNLKEYHCMVDFVKPNLLGTMKEFTNRFVNPIMNGQCADSSTYDVKLMKKRVHILHSLLNGCVQRQDYNCLSPYLPPKHEYVISIRLSPIQIKLYQYYLDNFAQGKAKSGSTTGTRLFKDFNALRQIWSHPYALNLHEIRTIMKGDIYSDEDEGMDFIDDSESAASSYATSDEDLEILSDDEKEKEADNSESETEEVIKPSRTTNRLNAACSLPEEDTKKTPEEEKFSKRNWWKNFYNEDEDFVNIELSGKICLLMEILKECEKIGDKVLLFSQSLLVLDLIQTVLKVIDEEEQILLEKNNENDEETPGSWVQGIDYFRMDGATNVDLRQSQIEAFNDENNFRARLFLISTKAGSLGTNLVGANRVIIMDASWNPTHDVQAIFRVYRFGQKKPCYIYRFLAQGTMEEKIYDRQVAKQSLSYRVLDEQQIERHFNASDLAELYKFNPDTVSNRPTPLVPKDLMFAELLIKHKEWISTYHEHDSLLQNQVDEDLTEEERKAAWNEYEAEKEGLRNNQFATTSNYIATNMNQTGIKMLSAMENVSRIYTNIIRNNPKATPEKIKSYLMSSLIMLNSNQHKLYTDSVASRNLYISRNEPLPLHLDGYISALEDSMKQLTIILQKLRDNQIQFKTTTPNIPQPGPSVQMPFSSSNIQMPRSATTVKEMLHQQNSYTGSSNTARPVIDIPDNDAPGPSSANTPNSYISTMPRGNIAHPIISVPVKKTYAQMPKITNSTVQITEVD